MEIRQGITNNGWNWIIHAFNMKINYEPEETPEEIAEVLLAMEFLQEVKSACPAIKLTLREKEDG